MEAISREFRVALPWELLYADDLAVIAETEEELIKRLNEWKDNVESKGMRVNMNKTKVMISGERQMVRQKAVRWRQCSDISRIKSPGRRLGCGDPQPRRWPQQHSANDKSLYCCHLVNMIKRSRL